MPAVGHGLPKIGVEAVVENYDAFLKMQDAIEKRVQKTAKGIEKSTKSSGGFGKIIDAATKDVNKFVQGLLQAVPGGHQFSGVLTQITAGLGSLSLGLVAVIAGIAALVAGFVALAIRGAPIRGLAESFDIQVRRVGLSSSKLIEELDKAARGTVSRLDLIKSANVALAGAVGEFGQQFGQALPQILQIARVQARATGQDVDFLFNSLVTGIKRSSPLLIDNTGLVLKVGEANQAYAESLGKTVEQLTAEEKQIALLQATLEAGARATEALGNAQEGASEKIARAQATINNILDTLGLAVQPVFEAILDVINGVLGAIQSGVNQIAPFIQFLATILGGIIQRVVQVAKIIISALGIQSPIGPELFKGAARMFGAFANAIIQTANQLIFPAIIGIATLIADFLVGSSPPPKGPLSEIDRGGAAMMEAWLQGITGIALDPVEEVAQSVADALGSVGGLTRRQIEAQFKALDLAVRPFENRLAIVKSRLEELSAPAEAALRVIDRQIESLTSDVLLGDREAALRLADLERQREAIQGQVDAQQELVDKEQIQVALARARQARERALLQVRLDQLGAEKRAQKESAKKKGAKAPKEKKLTGEAPLLPEEPGAGITPVSEAEASSPLDLIGGEEAGQAFDDLMAEFNGQIQNDGLAHFDANLTNLQTQVNRIKGVDIGDRLFGPLRDTISGLFDPANPTSIPALISNIDLSASISAVGTALQPLADLFNPDIEGSPMNTMKTLVGNLIDPNNVNSIPYRLGSIGGEIVSQLDRAKVSFAYFVDSIFNKNREGSPAYILDDFVQSIVDPEREGSIPHSFGLIGDRIQAATTELGTFVTTSIIDPIRNIIFGEGPGTIQGLMDSVEAFFSALPGRIVNALRSLGAAAWAAIVVPIVQVVNGIIGAVESGLRGLVQNVIDAITPLIGTLQGLGIDPGFFTDLVSGLEAAQRNISFDRIVPVMPEFLSGQAGGIDNSTTINATFNGVSGGQDAVRRFAGMRAMG